MLVVSFITILLTGALASPTSLTARQNAKATYYGGNLSGGNCMFTGYTLPSGLLGTAISGANWDASGICGTCLSVTGPKGTIKVMVVDNCPGCERDHLDLFQNAFSDIGNLDDGVIDISWNQVACGITSPLKLRNKSGTSKNWFSMQVFNSNEPVKSLEVSTDGGSSWSSTTRQEYNYFENSSGFGADTMDVRVTCTSGKQVVVSGVGIASGSEFTGSGNC